MKQLGRLIKKIMGEKKAKVVSDETKVVWKEKYTKVPKSLVNDNE